MIFARTSRGGLAASLLVAVIAFLPATIPLAQARTASSDVKAKVDALVTTFVPTATQSVSTASGISFTHPGIGLNKTLLDNMRDHVRAADEPWASAFVQFSAISSAKTAPLMRIFDDTARNYVNIPSGGISTDGYYIVRNMAQDAHTALVQTLMWYITGSAVYRQNAMNLIRQWNQVQSIGDIYDEQIRVSLAIYQFTYAAEILRSAPANSSTYDWSTADTTGFASLLNIMMSKYNRYTHFMNQHGMCAMATLGSAIFRNDATAYATAIQRATTNPELGASYDFTVASNPHNRDGAIFSQIREVTTNVSTGATVPANIQLMEMGRDQGHPYVGIGALTAVAMSAHLQGSKVDPSLGTLSTSSNAVEIFNFLDDRILYGANYLAKYNLGNSVTYIPSYSETNGAIYSAPTSADRGTFQATIGPLYNYYKYFDKRADMDSSESSKYLAQAFAKLYPEGDSQDFVGHGVLLYTLDDNANLAPGATIASSSSLENSSWGAARAADGAPSSSTASMGWSSNSSLTSNHVEWISFDLGSTRAINQIDLYPRTDGANAGYGFPVDFTLDLSTDGSTWSTAVTRSAYALPSAVQGFNFAFRNARYVRVRGSSLRANPSDAGRYRMQFAEVRIYGNYLSTTATLSTSSSQANSDWAPARVIDGLRDAVTGAKGWSSTSGAASGTEWLTLDLGDSKLVSEVTLYPRNDGGNAGYGFPVDFTIALSDDGVSWTTVVTKTAIALPAAGAGQSYTFGASQARYVRIQGTAFRANPGDGSSYKMQLSEVEVY